MEGHWCDGGLTVPSLTCHVFRTVKLLAQRAALNQEWMVACLCGHLSEARIGSVRSQRKAISLSLHEENELIQGGYKESSIFGEESCPSSGRKLKMCSAVSQAVC